MKAKKFVFFQILFFFIAGANIGSAQIYKWVDEKGTVHFSDSPASVTASGKNQSQGKLPDKTPMKPQDKAQREGLEKKQGNPTAKEGSSTSLKHLEVGSRYIPEDMKKYGPGGGSEQPRGADSSSSSAPRSSS